MMVTEQSCKRDFEQIYSNTCELKGIKQSSGIIIDQQPKIVRAAAKDGAEKGNECI